MIKSLWNNISYLGISSPNRDLQTRTILLCNQLNIGIALISLIVLIFLRIMGVIEGSSMGIGSLRFFLLFLVSIANLVLAYYGRHQLVKLSIIFLPLMILLIFPTLIGFIEAESFTYYPFVIIALSGTPQLLLLPDKNRGLYWSSLFYFFGMLLIIDSLLNHFAQEEFIIAQEINKFFPYFKAAQISIFIFVNIAVLYLRRINLKFETELAEANISLEKQSENLIIKNNILEKNRREIEQNYKELKQLQNELNNQNIELKDTLEDLKKTQQKLIQSEKLASLGTLTAGVAHEINNPLNFITGGLAIFHSELDDLFENPQLLHNEKELSSIKKRFDNSLKMIEEGIQKSSKIVSALREYSSGGKSTLKPCNIEEIIDSSISFLRGKTPMEVKIFKYYDLNIKVPVFKDKLHQVFMNILDNAVYALMRENTSVKEIHIHTHREGDYAVVSIQNTGVEIPKENENKVFDPFFTTKEPNEGTGLGLSMCYNIVQEHGGQIELINKKGNVGFIIKLELNPADA